MAPGPVEDGPEMERSRTISRRGAGAVVVLGCTPASPAASAGVPAGFRLVEVNRDPIWTLEDFERAMARAGRNVVLRLERGDCLAYYAVNRA
jgi:S1-C subfamily serine protease